MESTRRYNQVLQTCTSSFMVYAVAEQRRRKSVGVKRHLYYITRAFGFAESYDSAMSSIQGLIAKAKDLKNRIRLEGSFANMRV
ncbi:hypothetical protein V8E54_005431 [Elaphomyces granulatus]